MSETIIIVNAVMFFVYSNQMMRSMRKMKIHIKLKHEKETRSYYLSALTHAILALVCLSLVFITLMYND
jgi:hypothetical protein